MEFPLKGSADGAVRLTSEIGWCHRPAVVGNPTLSNKLVLKAIDVVYEEEGK